MIPFQLQTSSSSCSSDYTDAENTRFLIFGIYDTERQSYLKYTSDGVVYITGYCTGSFVINPPEYTMTMVSPEDKLFLIDAYFDSSLNVATATPDQLYNEVWKNGLFSQFYAHKVATHPEGFWAEEPYLKSWVKPCDITEMKKQGVLHIIVSFKVNKDGSLIDFVTGDYFDTDCYEEAVRVAKKMPHWIPEEVHGIPITTRSDVKVDFSGLLD